MGSDLSMNPPSEPVRRVVHNGQQTATYSRQTDLIYGAGRVNTWERDFIADDPDHIIFEAMKQTLHCPWVEAYDGDLDETLPKEDLEQRDRDWNTEELDLKRKLKTAKERVEKALENRFAAQVALNAFMDERREARK